MEYFKDLSRYNLLFQVCIQVVGMQDNKINENNEIWLLFVQQLFIQQNQEKVSSLQDATNKNEMARNLINLVVPP